MKRWQINYMLINGIKPWELNKMPCEKYKSEAQKNLCFATKEWTDWKGIREFKKKYSKGGKDE